ncbi:heavy metal translocating P-type ATPase [Cryobacterium luteum]|uniref:Cadmium-translocating P-type ATPase n=1 Tax=Cryobacterium luteum TaxID=1424661 RepID=A0A1H8CAV7_9MICO|nr:heavy metal translocating P-type ATPase [Cryobacterium luteum]TFB89312.1 cadmium-translocating P-type ATPase [Cryobacterium luteum]SEM92170.1 heavy metal-(Cd/Co/Hg/Pb/Zn)-translocating P-type ATPase [Cryobacterium luteum]
MTRIPAFALRYPVVSTTIVVGVLGLALVAVDAASMVRWLFSGYGLVVALIEFVGMLRRLRRGSLGIDLLAIIAIVATVLVGEYVATLLIVLMLAGGAALEDFAAGRAARELDALLKRAPQIAHRLDPDSGEATDVAATEVRVGDLLLVRPSEIVPVDGQLHSDSAAFDESSLTGESLPVERAVGDGVLSGSINGQVAATIVATATAANSQYQQIIALVDEASKSKAPVVRLADRYAVPFTVGSLALAGLAWALSGDPVRFAEVLVVATPCPLLLAAPVAFMGGMSRAARNGIIVKGAGVLEALSRARTVVFDKTGTLTYGTPAITEVRPEAGFTADELLTLAASAEQYSSHVLAASVIGAAHERGLTLHTADSASEAATFGVEARFGDGTVRVGKLTFITDEAADATATHLAGGELAMYVAVDGRFAGSIVASDRVRANARQSVADLARLGVRENLMLTGDARATAQHVAGQVGIVHVRADCLPSDKVEAVRALTRRPVIMVGDGVNDAPVLAVADVGIAMGAKGATAASESADAVILLDDISRVVSAVRIGKDTVRVALHSIWLGIMLSVVLMVVAAFGLIPATAGAISQEVVDLVTILNALRAIGGRRDRAAARRAPVSAPPTPAASAAAVAP